MVVWMKSARKGQFVVHHEYSQYNTISHSCGLAFANARMKVIIKESRNQDERDHGKSKAILSSCKIEDSESP